MFQFLIRFFFFFLVVTEEVASNKVIFSLYYFLQLPSTKLPVFSPYLENNHSIIHTTRLFIIYLFTYYNFTGLTLHTSFYTTLLQH